MSIRNLSRLVSVIALAAAAACGGTLSTSTHVPINRLDGSGVRPRLRAVDAGTLLQFVNDDVRPHEIYSNDCHELASVPLAPGQAYTASIDRGPKECHFQDLFAPAAEEYWGTVQVNEPPAAPEEISGS